MSAVTQMSQADQSWAGRDDDRERYVAAQRWRRELSIQQAYLLRAKLDACRTWPERDAILQDWAEASGQAKFELEKQARWTEGIGESDLRDAFKAEQIAEAEWLERLGVGHLELLGEAKAQKSKRLPNSKEKAAWMVKAFHGNWGVPQLREALREDNLLPREKANMRAAPSKKLMAGQLLIEIGTHMLKSGADYEADLLKVDLTKPWQVWRLLGLIMETMRKLYPRAEYTPVKAGAQKGESTAP